MAEDDNKQCPFCAETIKASAVLCRFCNKELLPKVSKSIEKSLDKKTTSAFTKFLAVVFIFYFGDIALKLMNGTYGQPKEPQVDHSQETKTRRAQLCRERLADMRDALLNHDWRKAKEHLGVALAHAEESGDPVLLSKMRQIQKDFYAEGYAP